MKYPTMCDDIYCWQDGYRLEKRILSLITAAFVSVCSLLCAYFGHRFVGAILTVPCNLILTDAWERTYANVYSFGIVDKVIFVFTIFVLIYKLYPNISDSSKEARA